ncbi:unnamed protein product [Chironomus riparius]|uniref:Uncharacterized protein n=1 Tax=Chironomus riparius TaxID=315576 RepID=A0A9N9RUK5_9DIPT|nr:unnamed protein product [Chironomus riparius]
MSSELENLSDILELPFVLFGESIEEMLPESLRPTLIEAVCLPSINSSLPNNELYQMENASTNDREFLDISYNIGPGISSLDIENTPIVPNSIKSNTIKEQNCIKNNTNDVDSNANFIKLMNAEEELKELEKVKQRLRNEHLQLKKKNEEIKREIIEFVKINNIQFDANIIKKILKRKNLAKIKSLTSISSPAPSPSTCSSDNPKNSRGRPNKELYKATIELEEVKPKLNQKEFKIASNNLASIKSRKNKNKKLNELCAEEQMLTELRKDLNKKYRRNRNEITRIMKSAIKIANKL